MNNRSTQSTGKPLLDALLGKKPSRTPIWFMRQAGRCLPEYRKIKESMNTYDMFQTPSIASTITLQPLKRFDYDAAIVYADILHIADVLGGELSFVPSLGPLLKRPIQNTADIIYTEKLFNRMDQCLEKLSFVQQTLLLTKKHLTSEQALIGFAGSPWSVACYMIAGKSPGDCRNVKLWMLNHPTLFAQLMEMITQLTIEYLSHQIDAGADTIQLFESHAGMALSYRQYQTFALPYIIQICEELQKRKPHTPLIYYINNSAGILPHIHSSRLPTLLKGFGVDFRQPLANLSQYPHFQHLTLQGNLDPLTLYASTDYLTHAVEDILKQGREHQGGFIFNVGHGLTPQTPLPAIKKVIELTHR
ncbi:MAG: uroporphyrinogen decarboxylase [Proteobacteria bacterium]|nr:uroporphyrinogen decarboxylase [Pseudomonadota bacterium]